MKEDYMIAMGKDELDDFVKNNFKSLDTEAQRAFVTMMLLCADYVDFLIENGLWDQFVGHVEEDSVEVH